MSKGLEALHHPRIELAKIDISAEGKHDIAYMPFYKTKQYGTIENELKECEELKNYHEFTEIVEKIHSKVCDSTLQENIRLINENTKLEQLLNIIKEKVIPLVQVYDNMVYDNEEYEHKELTPEEFNLLKGWIER